MSSTIYAWSPDTSSTYTPRYQCAGYNDFLQGDSSKALGYYVDKIYPTGLIRFDPVLSHELGGFAGLEPYLDICSGCTFQLQSTSVGRLDSSLTYSRYQQYYLGVEVEGGGYTLVTDDDNPCGITYLSPFIASGFGVPTSPQINRQQLANILAAYATGPVVIDTATMNEQLLISQHLLGDCGYHLTWRANYQDSGEDRMAWVDALYGTVLKSVSINVNAQKEEEDHFDQSYNWVNSLIGIFADTELYGNDQRL